MDFDLKAREILGGYKSLVPDVAAGLKAAYSAGLAEREKMEAVVNEVRKIVYKDVNTWRVGVHGDSPVPALGAALSALDGVKDGGR